MRSGITGGPVIHRSDLRLHPDQIILGEDEETHALFIDWKRFDISVEEGQYYHHRIFETLCRERYEKLLVDASVTRGRLDEAMLDFAVNQMVPDMNQTGLKYVGVVVPIDLSGQCEMERWAACFSDHVEIRSFFIHSDARDWLNSVGSEN